MGTLAEERMNYALRLHDMGVSIDVVCSKLGISRRTFYCWKGKREAHAMGEHKTRNLESNPTHNMNSMTALPATRYETAPATSADVGPAESLSPED